MVLLPISMNKLSYTNQLTIHPLVTEALGHQNVNTAIHLKRSKSRLYDVCFILRTGMTASLKKLAWSWYSSVRACISFFFLVGIALEVVVVINSEVWWQALQHVPTPL